MCCLPKYLMALFTVVLFAGCGVQEALNYNNTVVGANQRLTKAGQAFGISVQRALDGGPAEIQKCRTEYDACVKVAKDVRDSAKTVKVPNSLEARNLQSVHQEFLAEQVSICEDDFGEIVTVIENESLSVEEKRHQIGAVFEKISEIEPKSLARLQAAQRKFAKAHNIKLQ